MANSQRHQIPSRKALVNENLKIAKLRDLRLARDSARRQAGTWGDMSVGEILHEPTGEVFVFSWKGDRQPDLPRLNRSRLPEVSLAEHELLKKWLARHKTPDFTQALVGWSLSRIEAKRAKQARIDERRASGCQVINEVVEAA